MRDNIPKTISNEELMFPPVRCLTIQTFVLEEYSIFLKLEALLIFSSTDIKFHDILTQISFLSNFSQ